MTLANEHGEHPAHPAGGLPPGFKAPRQPQEPRMPQWLAQLPPELQKKLAEKPGVIEHMTLLPAQLTTNAAQAAAAGKPELLEQLAELAQAEKKPEPLGLFGRIGKIIKGNAKNSITQSLIIGGGWGGVTVAAHKLGGENLPFIGSRPDKKTIESVDQGLKNAGSDKRFDDLRPPVDAWELAAERGGIIAGLSFGMTNLIACFTQQDVVKQEDEMRGKLWDMMHAQANGAGRGEAAAGAATFQPDPGVIPHGAGRGPQRG